MNSARKSLSLLIATFAPLASPAVGAAGLGDLVVRSALGEPLRAEIRVVGQPGEQIDASCFRRASRSTGDDIPWLHTARLRLAGEVLLVSTREALNHPVAMLGVEVTCGTQLRRDYPILLQPPQANAAPPQADDASPAVTTPRPAVRASRPSRPAPPDAAAGAQQRPAAPSRPSRATRTDTPPARHAEPPRHDRLILGNGAEAGLVPLRMSLLLANPPKGDEPDAPRQPLRQEQRTLAEIDDRIAAQLEVNEKIKRLEEYQAMLKERVAQLDGQPPSQPAPARPAPPPAAAPAPATHPAGAVDQSDWARPLAGLLAVLLGGGALMWLRRRRNVEPAPSVEPTTQPDFRLSAPPSSTPAARKPPAREEARAMPPAQHSVAQSPAADHAGTGAGDWAEPTFAPAHPIPFDETVDEHDSALELAEIMMSFGRTQGAAETLADYIRSNPRQAVKPWLKLLEVYHVAGMRAEFEVLTRQLNKTFNVKMISWNDFRDVRAMPDSVEQIGHVSQRLQDLWGTQEAQVYVHQILRDNRNGTRQGFALSVVEELLLLLAILDEELGPYKPNTELTLEEMNPPSAQAPAPFET